MLKKVGYIKNCALLKYFNLNSINQRSISALYITGDKAKENYAVLQPYMDFKEIFDNSNDMINNIKNRKLTLDFELIQDKYEKFQKILNQKRNLENEKNVIVEQMRLLNKNKELQENEKVTFLKEEGRKVKENLKDLKQKLYSVEDDFIQDFLCLPNKIHQMCPIEHEKILYRKGLPDEKNKNSIFHLENKDLINYKDPTCYYLLNKAAIFDLELSLNCTNYIVKNGFTQITNPDFSKRILLEAIYSDNISEFEEIKEREENNNSKFNTLHLNGGGSFVAFLGFITKLSIFPSSFPLKLVSLGRQYITYPETKQNKGLFNATQSNIIQTFIATKDQLTADEEMNNILNIIIDIYKKFDVNFRIIYEKAENIIPSSSLKASIQIFSPYFNEYIEVGYINNYENYLSKRILFNYKEDKNFKFPYIVGGTIVDISKILGCLIENNCKLECPSFKCSKTAVDEFKSLFN